MSREAWGQRNPFRTPVERQLEIEIRQHTFTADLLEKWAPRTCKAVLDILPFETEGVHSFWSGQHIMIHNPILKRMAGEHGLWPDPGFPDYGEHPTVYGCPGDVGFYAKGAGLWIVFERAHLRGPMEGEEPGYVFARIPQKEWADLWDIGSSFRWEGGQKIKIRLQK